MASQPGAQHLWGKRSVEGAVERLDLACAQARRQRELLQVRVHHGLKGLSRSAKTVTTRSKRVIERTGEKRVSVRDQ